MKAIPRNIVKRRQMAKPKIMNAATNFVRFFENNKEAKWKNTFSDQYLIRKRRLNRVTRRKDRHP